MAEEQVRDINVSVNQAALGLNTDSTLLQVKTGTLTYALNAQVSSFDGQTIAYQNEQSNVLCSEIKKGYRVIGYHSITEQNRTVLFLVNPDTGDSEIGELKTEVYCDVDNPTNLTHRNRNDYVNNGYNSIGCDKEDCTEDEPVKTFYERVKNLNPTQPKPIDCCSYKTLINSKCLNFNVNFPIHKAVHRIVDANDDANKCGTEIYWADGLNPRRYFNLDDLPFKEDIYGCDRIKNGEVDCDLLEVQPVVTIPCITPVVADDGGSIIAGTYQFAVQYATDRGVGFTDYYSITNPIGIFKSRYGLDYNFQTDKSIKLVISNLDTKFTYYNLAVIKTVNGAVDVELVGTYNILNNTQEINYTGNNKTQINLTIDDIFSKSSYYSTASKVNVVDDVLMWSGLKSPKRVNYQSVANKIKIEWQTHQIPYTPSQGYNNGINTATYRGYMRDEVYAFEIVFLLKNGKQTEGFHIPGRASTPLDTFDVSNEDVLVTEIGSCIIEPDTQPVWKVYNTASVTGFSPEFLVSSNPDCYTGPHRYGEMAYWESEKEYPCNTVLWGDLAGKKIRHHKFPDNSIVHIHDDNPNETDKSFEHKIYPIGIKIDLDNIKKAIVESDLTGEEQSKIAGFKIVRSNRVNNKSVIAKGLLYNVGSYTPYNGGVPATNQEVFYPNYPFNDLGSDPFLTNLSSVNDGDFNVNLLENVINDTEFARQHLDNIDSVLPTLTEACYTVLDTCAIDTTGVPVIQLTLAQISSLQNLIFISRNFSQTLIDQCQSIINVYNDKIQNNEVICQTDVAAFTLASNYVTDFTASVADINNSAARLNFQDIVTYVTNNALALNSHPNSTDIFSLRTSSQNILNVNVNLQAEAGEIGAGFSNYNDALADLALVNCNAIATGGSDFSSTRFTFHSPDTHFYQPFLGSILKFETLEGGTSIGNFVQVQGHAGAKLMSTFSAGLALAAGVAVGILFAAEPRQYNVRLLGGAGFSYYAPSVLPSFGTIAEKSLFWNKTFKELIYNLIPWKNYAYQYNAIGIYNQSVSIPNNGFKQRELDKSYYLTPGMQTLGDIFPINNWRRESSVYFKTIQSKPSPLLPSNSAIRGALKEDDSRVDYSDDKQIYSNVLSYYASNKRKFPDQYGDIYSYEVVDTGYCGVMDVNKDYTNRTDTVFGGDVFINRFGLKRKLPFFIDNNVGKPDGTDVFYSDLSNVGKVRYWYNTDSGKAPGSGFKGLIKSILDVPQSQLQGNTNKLFYQNGRIFLFAYGISYFFVESEVNVDFRQAGNPKDKDFYPNVSTGIPNEWLQEKEVPIVHDNYYIYNGTYSKQNKENYFSHLPLDFNPSETCKEDFSHKIIYSEPNAWKVYRPLNYFDFPKIYGQLTSVDTIDDNQVLVRFENKSYIYNALTSMQATSGKNLYLRNEDVFKTKPVDLGNTDLGYAGSAHSLFLRTEAGHLFIDTKRKAIFTIKGTGVENISNVGISTWLERNLDFSISRFFPSVNIDNAYNGIGITGVWDNKYKRFIISKLDYTPLPDKVKDITYDSYYGKFKWKNLDILLEDPTYFCNKSWTLSYSPVTKSWVSWHSYIPNFYIPLNGRFLTGKNAILSNQKSSLWLHNAIHTSYNNFYGKLEPYILEYPFAYKFQDETFQSIKDQTTILEYYNENEFHEINNRVYFNKAILYNNQQCSGLRKLFPKPQGDLSKYFNYPKNNTDSVEIIFTKSDNSFNYNQIWDTVKNPNNHIPIWKDSCINKSIDKELNSSALDYSTRGHQKTKLRAKDLKIRHINDYHSRYKFISKFLITLSKISHK